MPCPPPALPSLNHPNTLCQAPARLEHLSPGESQFPQQSQKQNTGAFVQGGAYFEAVFQGVGELPALPRSAARCSLGTGTLPMSITWKKTQIKRSVVGVADLKAPPAPAACTLLRAHRGELAGENGLFAGEMRRNRKSEKEGWEGHGRWFSAGSGS